jgi:hypothetical protein
LNEKKNGYFLEIGSGLAESGNNTYILETDYNWKGIMIDINGEFLEEYEKKRPNSTHLICNATKLDYNEELNKCNFPKDIDYLSFDLDVGDDNSTMKTLNILNSQIFDTYRFAVISFEHDVFRHKRNNKTRLESREIFEERNYVRVFSDVSESCPERYHHKCCENGGAVNPFEDWYVHPELVDMDYVRELQELNKNNYTEPTITHGKERQKPFSEFGSEDSEDDEYLSIEYKIIEYPDRLSV